MYAAFGDLLTITFVPVSYASFKSKMSKRLLASVCETVANFYSLILKTYRLRYNCLNLTILHTHCASIFTTLK